MAGKSRSLSFFLFLCALLSGVIFYGCGGGGGTSSSSVPLQISGNVTSIIPLAGMRDESSLSPDLRAAASLAGVEVYLENYREQNSTLSDADGRYLLSGVPAGSHYIVAMKKTATYTLKVRSTEAISVSESRPAVQAGSMALKSATATASGRLVDAAGNSVPNGRLTLWGEAFYTDSNGYYTTPAMPENVTAPIVVAVPGYQPTEIQVKFTDNPPFVEQTIVNTASTNRPPTSSLVASRYSVSPSTTVALSATASDPDQELGADNFSWAITGNIGTFSGSISGLKVVWVAPNENAIATVTFIVTDNGGVKSQSSVQIVVGTGIYEPNVAPTVSAISSDLAVPIYTGSTGLLSVVATDTNGDQLYYKWSGEGSFSSLSASSTYWTTPDVDVDEARTVRVTLLVDDRKGGLATATRDFVINYVENDPPNTPQITSPLANLLVLPGQSVNFAGSASDPQDGVLTGAAMSWYLNGSLIKQGSANFTYNVPTVPATYAVRLQAVDKYGVSASTTINIRVNSTPTVSIIAPTNNATLPIGSAINFNASSNDVEGVIPSASYTWTFPKIGVRTGNPYNLAGGSLDEGSNEIKVSVVDSMGVGATATINITIDNSGPIVQIVSPTATAIAKDSIVSIEGSGFDNVTKAALPAASMTWKLYDGKVATYTLKEGDDKFDTSFTTPGPHVLTLTGSDRNGKTTSVSHSFNVNVSPVIQKIDLPASGTRYDLGADITFKATVTDSPGEEAFLNASWSSSLADGYLGTASSGADLIKKLMTLGSHKLTCEGINSRSGMSVSSETMILVNTLPVGTLTLDLTNQYATAPGNIPVFLSENSSMEISMEMSASDPDGIAINESDIEWFTPENSVPFATGSSVKQYFPLGLATVTVRIYDSFRSNFEDHASSTYNINFYVWQSEEMPLTATDINYIWGKGADLYVTANNGGSPAVRIFRYVDGDNPSLTYDETKDNFTLTATCSFELASASVLYGSKIMSLGVDGANAVICTDIATGAPKYTLALSSANFSSLDTHPSDETLCYLTAGTGASTALIKYNPLLGTAAAYITEAEGKSFDELQRVRYVYNSPNYGGKVFAVDTGNDRVVRYLFDSVSDPRIITATSPVDVAFAKDYAFTLSDSDSKISVHAITNTGNVLLMEFGGANTGSSYEMGKFKNPTGLYCYTGKDLFILDKDRKCIHLIRSGMSDWLSGIRLAD